MSDVAPFEVLLYYLYCDISDPEVYVAEHRKLCEELGLMGRIIVAEEGINGTVSGTAEAAAQYRAALENDPVTSAVQWKIDPAEDHVFPKLSIKVRPEIVALGLEQDLDPRAITGERLAPAEWKEKMEREDVVLVDGRNRYEWELGRFDGALCPPVDNFRDFPKWLEENRETLEGKQVMTYCTGGIRCEKLSGLLVREGIKDVFQLEGGIVTYGKDEQTKGEGFHGKCYVFDQRVGVEVNEVDAQVISVCRRCEETSDRYKNCRFAPCNDQFFCCESCEEKVGRFCCDECGEKEARQLEAKEVAVD